MNRGQKPTPTAFKVLTGNPGKRPINQAEPQPDGEVKKPAFVKGGAARLWVKYAPDLQTKGVLTAWDVDMFGCWCVLMADFQKNPQMFTAAQMSQMRALASAFGLLPAERARLKTGKEGPTKDPAQKYFGGSRS